MPELEHEAIDASVRAKKGADTAASERIDIANKYYGLIKWVGFGLIAATVWVVTIQIDVSSLKITKGQRDVQIDALKTYDTANDKVIGQIGSRIDQQKGDIDRTAGRLDKIEPEHQEMWFMKTHGIPNRLDFFQKHGYYPPGQEESPSPTPR